LFFFYLTGEIHILCENTIIDSYLNYTLWGSHPFTGVPCQHNTFERLTFLKICWATLVA